MWQTALYHFSISTDVFFDYYRGASARELSVAFSKIIYNKKENFTFFTIPGTFNNSETDVIEPQSQSYSEESWKW